MQLNEPRHWVLIPAAGVGARVGADRPKQYLRLHGRMVMDHTLDCFLSHSRIAGCVVVLGRDDPFWSGSAHAAHPAVLRAQGGAERFHSVANGLDVLAEHASDRDWVLVHDAARPCLRRSDLDKLIDALRDEPVGALLAVPVHDTVKQAAEGKQASDGKQPADDLRVAQTLSRDGLWRAFTPQAFRLGPLRQALRDAMVNGITITDDASAMELAGLAPQLVEGHADNIKITRPEDISLAEFFLNQQNRLG